MGKNLNQSMSRDRNSFNQEKRNLDDDSVESGNDSGFLGWDHNRRRDIVESKSLTDSVNTSASRSLSHHDDRSSVASKVIKSSKTTSIGVKYPSELPQPVKLPQKKMNKEFEKAKNNDADPFYNEDDSDEENSSSSDDTDSGS